MRNEYDDTIAGKKLSPESLMMSYGYRPEWSEGAIKSPIFQTSTFVFQTAAEGKRFFELAEGSAEAAEGEKPGLIYSRLNNPDLEILENRLTLWDGAERGLVFASGMAAITTTMLAYLRPGDVLLHSAPIYGGTDHFVHGVLPEFGVRTVKWEPEMSEGDVDAALEAALEGRRLGAVLMETPANPTNDLFSIAMARRIADRHGDGERRVPVAVDNTFLGPLWQQPLQHGADLVIYSATKYIGGHSDLIAGAVLGSHEVMNPVVEMRTVLGSMATPLTSWLMMRSLETLDLRMRRETETAKKIAAFLVTHPKVVDVGYLGLLEEGDPGYEIYKEQVEGPGAMITFWIDGDEEEAFRFIDSLSLIHLAVSLGSTETLVEHPATMT
ncbi:MAG: aminotransferase class I/II-fold pyridoxal phosphate-dependent enzyme, partial [Actinomycetota bacterium]|nr:aminotransferase class I/II-fold pyridoxal phosphate-dependent enzyme [Actinomycetota bacterium]